MNLTESLFQLCDGLRQPLSLMYNLHSWIYGIVVFCADSWITGPPLDLQSLMIPSVPPKAGELEMRGSYRPYPHNPSSGVTQGMGTSKVSGAY